MSLTVAERIFQFRRRAVLYRFVIRRLDERYAELAAVMPGWDASHPRKRKLITKCAIHGSESNEIHPVTILGIPQRCLGDGYGFDDVARLVPRTVGITGVVPWREVGLPNRSGHVSQPNNAKPNNEE